jgi:predicted metal-dependent peptidase
MAKQKKKEIPQTVQERIAAIHERWFLREPTLLMALLTHAVEENPQIQEIRSGKGRIEYNPAYAEGLSDTQLEHAFKAEVVRILLRHPYRYPPRNGTVSYTASNIVLNEYEPGLNLTYKLKDFWNEEEYEKQNFEFYYNEILKLMPQQNQSGDSGDDSSESESESNGSNNANGTAGTDKTNDTGNSGDTNESNAPSKGESHSPQNSDTSDSQGSDSQGSDNQNSDSKNSDAQDSDSQNTELWDEDDFMDEKIKEVVEWMERNTQSWGSLKGDLAETILATLKPQMDYRKVLRGFRQSVLASSKMLTRFRPSRRYGFDTMGKKCKFTTSVLVGIDTSGSISTTDLQKFFSAVNRFFKYGIETIDAQMFDSGLQGEPIAFKKARRSIKAEGRGGTSFQPIVNFFEKNQKRYDGLIVFTDGYAQIPTLAPGTRRKIAWVCDCEANYRHHKDWMEKNGRCCWIK